MYSANAKWVCFFWSHFTAAISEKNAGSRLIRNWWPVWQVPLLVFSRRFFMKHNKLKWKLDKHSSGDESNHIFAFQGSEYSSNTQPMVPPKTMSSRINNFIIPFHSLAFPKRAVLKSRIATTLNERTTCVYTIKTCRFHSTLEYAMCARLASFKFDYYDRHNTRHIRQISFRDTTIGFNPLIFCPPEFIFHANTHTHMPRYPSSNCREYWAHQEFTHR